MDFLALQTELAELHMDTSSAWIAGGASNKKAVNKAYEFVYDSYKGAERVKRKIFKQKVEVVIKANVGTLPSDFSLVDRVSLSPFDTTTDMLGDSLDNDCYYDFEITGLGTVSEPYKIIVNDQTIPRLYVSYVPVRADLVNNTDVPKLPIELHRSIADYALVEYYRRIRDNVEAGNALTLANQYINERLKRL